MLIAVEQYRKDMLFCLISKFGSRELVLRILTVTVDYPKSFRINSSVADFCLVDICC